MLSPSNASVDREIKRGVYARAGVPEYWIVRPAQRDLLVYSQPDGALGDFAQNQRFSEAQEVGSSTLPVRFAVDGIFAGAPDTTL